MTERCRSKVTYRSEYVGQLQCCKSHLIIYELFELFSLADDKKDKTSTAVTKTNKSDVASKLPTTPTKAPKTSATAAAASTATPVTPTSAAAQSAPTTPLGVNLAKVDLGKISSILSSLTSAMKTTGVFWEMIGEIFLIVCVNCVYIYTYICLG